MKKSFTQNIKFYLILAYTSSLCALSPHEYSFVISVINNKSASNAHIYHGLVNSADWLKELRFTDAPAHKISEVNVEVTNVKRAKLCIERGQEELFEGLKHLTRKIYDEYTIARVGIVIELKKVIPADKASFTDDFVYGSKIPFMGAVGIVIRAEDGEPVLVRD